MTIMMRRLAFNGIFFPHTLYSPIIHLLLSRHHRAATICLSSEYNSNYTDPLFCFVVFTVTTNGDDDDDIARASIISRGHYVPLDHNSSHDLMCN